MKKRYHHSTKKKAYIRFYTPPHTWVTGNLSNESLLGESEEMKTTIKDGYADSDGRSNGWNGFDDSEANNAPSLWDE